MKNFKCRLKNIHCSAITSIVDLLLIHLKTPSSEEALLIAVLNEISLKIKSRQLVYKQEYKFSFTPIQALALRVLWEEYIIPQMKPADHINEFYNRFRLLNNEILKTYPT